MIFDEEVFTGAFSIFIATPPKMSMEFKVAGVKCVHS
jgi:hypothetical protein